jgi:16S rRNA (cytosine967-C5)-methyltransferase
VAQISARGVALAALRTWRTKYQFADAIVSDALSKSALESPDRAFALDLFYGVLRNLTLLDFWIHCLRPTRIDVDLRDLLRLGLYQLFIAETPEYAAVNETVALAPKRQRSIVNAILRSATRERAELLTKANAQPLDVRSSHPKFLIDRWKKQFGDDAAKHLCEWNNHVPLIYARINQLKIDRRAFLNRYRDARSLANLPNFVELAAPAGALAIGDCYVQDPSTAIACQLLDPKPNEKILDACAAPGGKTSYLAELMESRGLLVACDREPKRLHLLEENLAQLGVQVGRIIRQDWTKQPISKEITQEAPFDRILIDAPCGNTGVMRRRVDVRWRLKPADFPRMQARQIQIVREVIPLLKPGGILVYATCSLEREENEDVVQTLLRKISILRLEDERSSLPFRDNFDGAYAARLCRVA